MKKIKIHEAKESLETLILGINKDPKRIMFDQMIESLEDYEIERIERLDYVGVDISVQEVKHHFDSYPNAEELAELLSLDSAVFKSIKHESDLVNHANRSRLGACCGVGEDIYLDPNEN